MQKTTWVLTRGHVCNDETCGYKRSPIVNLTFEHYLVLTFTYFALVFKLIYTTDSRLQTKTSKI